MSPDQLFVMRTNGTGVQGVTTKRDKMSKRGSPLDREYVAGLEKGLAVIEAFGQRRSALTITEASDAALISRASARRCLLTLQYLGYADHDGKYFRLAPRVLRLGYAYFSSNSLPRLVQPIIEATSEHTKRSVSLAILDRADVIVIARAHVQRSLAEGIGIGSHLRTYCSANGRALLSGFSDQKIASLLGRKPLPRLTVHTKTKLRDILSEIQFVRVKGYARNEEEVEIGVRTIAVPIRGRSGDILASLSMSAPVGVSDHDDLLKLLPELENARRRIEDIV